MNKYIDTCIIAFSALTIVAQSNDQELISEHVYGGLPSSDNLLIRNAYVSDYDMERKAPRWVAYHLIENYRLTPKREGKWQRYRSDPDVNGEPAEKDYKGAYGDSIRNYARGHLAPFMISGGDRDGDGFVLDHDKNGEIDEAQNDDPDEGITVEQINYHTNLTPQHHNSFNGVGGIWYKIESHIREILPDKKELWVFAGPIFGKSSYDSIGKDVEVAPMFFQIIAWEDSPGQTQFQAFMMPHHQKAHGEIEDYLVSIRHIEAMTGLDFFHELELSELERVSTF